MSSSSESDSDCDKQEQSTSGKDIFSDSNATVSEPEPEPENSTGQGLLCHGGDEDGPGSRSRTRDSERYSPNNETVDDPHATIEGEGENNRKSSLLEFNNHESNQASWGLWLMVSLSINVGFLFAILYLVQNLSGRVSNMELNTWDNNVAMDNLKFMYNIEQKSLRSEIDSMRKAASWKHDQQEPEPEPELDNKISNVGENRSEGGQLENKKTVDDFPADGYHRNGNLSLQECHDQSNLASSGLIWLIVSVLINVAVLLLVLYLVQKAELNTKIRRIEENFVEFEKELRSEIEKLQEENNEFVSEYELDRNPAYAPYVQIADQLKDLNWIQNMIQTTTAQLESGTKESWLTDYQNVKSLFDKNGDFKSIKSQNIELGALLDKAELSIFASTLRDKKHYREALGLYEKMYKRSLVTRGINHVNTLKVQYRLALCLNNLKESKETEKAFELYRFVQEKRSETLYPTHVDTLNAQHSIAVSLHRLGRYKEALHLYEDVYSLQAKHLGINHEHTVQTKQNMEIAKSRK